MKTRRVITTIDTILELFKDYCPQEDIPADAQAERLMIKPTEMGKFAIVVESPSIRAGLDPLVVHFDIKRYYGVGE